jgi:hypothetical protein
MAIQTPFWTPPQTPTVSPNPSEPAFANAGYQVEVPEIATDAHVKSEDLDYHLGTNNHSSTLIASYSPDVFENTHFGHHELYVRESESNPWHAVPYVSSFNEQYSLLTEAAEQGHSCMT